jgi:DNA-binding HxlR family transcriptional regulator
MDDDARNLLATISEKGADALLRELLDGARTETELRVATSLTHRAAHERLAKLERLGLIAAAERATTEPGRPPREWQLVRAEPLARFAEQATALRQALKANI